MRVFGAKIADLPAQTPVDGGRVSKWRVWTQARRFAPRERGHTQNTASY